MAATPTLLDQTWQLILDLERHISHEVVSGVEVGLELGYAHGRSVRT